MGGENDPEFSDILIAACHHFVGTRSHMSYEVEICTKMVVSTDIKCKLASYFKTGLVELARSQKLL